MAVRPIPKEYHRVTPYLVMKDAAKAIAFYKKVFDARERMRFDAPGGGIAHAEIEIGDAVIMLADESPDMGHRGPHALGGTPVSLMLYVEKVDDVFARALAAGAKEMRPVKDQFYGDRCGTLTDPFGHVWSIATHIEDVPEQELKRRLEEEMSRAPDA